MLRHRRFSSPSIVQLYEDKEASNLRKQAEGMPLSIRRDELFRKASQAEAISGARSGTPSPRDRQRTVP
jgi:hypothetical protein